MNSDGAPPPFGDLPRSARYLVFARLAGFVLVVFTLLLTAYYVTPNRDIGPASLALRVLAAIGVIAVATVAAINIVNRSVYPMLGLIQGLVTVVGVCVVVFASLHLLLSTNNPAAYSEQLDHTGALYFTVTTLTTVGYGDISPRSDVARIVTMIHMAVNVVVLGAGVQSVVQAMRRRVGEHLSE